MPMKVPIDSGLNFIDQNGHRMKDFVLLPLIRAVEDMTDQGATPKFNWPSVDIVTDRGRLRKLLGWALGESDKWRIDTQLAGTSTVLLTGRAPITKETNGRSTSYGFNFEEASTYPAPGLEEETSHHRIITYVCLVLVLERLDPQRCQNFGGLKMVVRFEVDACLPCDALSTSSSHDSTVLPESGGRPTTGKPSSRLSSNPHDVKIIRAGSQVPQTHLLEIKTHSRSNPKWARTYPQLYLSQTPHIYYASHTKGVFSTVTKYTTGEGYLVSVDQSAREGFKKLRKLLGEIKSLVQRYGATRISLVCEGRELKVYRIPEGQICLPKDALALFVA